MKKYTVGVSIASCLLVLSQTAWAVAFVVRDIQVNGLERVPAGTVLNYLPVQIGQTFDDNQTPNAIRALFQTGLFEDVQLTRRGDVLLVSVVERPAIGEINIKGNRKIPTDKLMAALKVANLAKGDTLDKAALIRIQQELEQQYQAMGTMQLILILRWKPCPVTGWRSISISMKATFRVSSKSKLWVTRHSLNLFCSNSLNLGRVALSLFRF